MTRKNKDVYTLSDIFREMELELILSAKQTLSRHENWEGKLGFKWEQWQESKLRSIRSYQVNNRKIIKSYQSDIKDTIDDVIRIEYDETYQKSLDLSKEIFSDFELDTSIGSKTPYESDIRIPEENFFHVNDEKLNVMVEEMQDTFTNSEGLIMRKMDDTYRQVVDKAALKLASGTMTVQQAVDSATKEFIDKGIDCITYKNGRKVNIASYAEMYLRTANQQAGFLASGKARDRFKVYTVLMSQHSNCSPMCLPYQGTVMIDDVYTQLSKEDAMAMSEHTGYERLSIAMENHAFHPNCRHSLVTWYEGRSTIPNEFTPLDNEVAVERYKAEQKQRRLEREISKWKRIEKGSLAEENIDLAKSKVRTYQKELREMIKSNPDLRRNYWRERASHILDENVPELEKKMILTLDDK